MQEKTGTWIDVPLTSTDAFEATCEYRFRHTLPGTWPKPGEYWSYANMVSPTNIIFEALAGNLLYVSSSNKGIFNSTAAPYPASGTTIEQMQKRCDLSINTGGLTAICPE